MSDKSKYTIFEMTIPGFVYIKPNVNVLCVCESIQSSTQGASVYRLLF